MKPCGVYPPSSLVAQTKALCGELGPREAARVLCLSRGTIYRVIRRMSVHKGTIAMLAAHFGDET